jgi:uncharacterized membrane protein YoaK (UPF0700 family)
MKPASPVSALPAPPAPAAAPAARLFAHISDLRGGFLLCVVGGYVDAAGWLGLFGLFTGSITGNLVLAGSAVAATARGVVPRVVVTAVFLAGGCVGGALAAALQARSPGLPPRRLLLVLLALELASLVALWLAGQQLLPSLTSIDAPSVALVGSLAALAMGLQASAVKECLPGYPSTTVLTTTLTTVGALAGGAAHAAAGAAGLAPSHLPPEARAAALAAKLSALARAAAPVAGFMLGVCVGAGLQHLIDFNSTFVPVAVVLFLMRQLALPLPAAPAPPAAALEPSAAPAPALEPPPAPPAGAVALRAGGFLPLT